MNFSTENNSLSAVTSRGYKLAIWPSKPLSSFASIFRRIFAGNSINSPANYSRVTSWPDSTCNLLVTATCNRAKHLFLLPFYLSVTRVTSSKGLDRKKKENGKINRNKYGCTRIQNIFKTQKAMEGFTCNLKPANYSKLPPTLFLEGGEPWLA